MTNLVSALGLGLSFFLVSSISLAQQSITFDFSKDHQGFSAGFADYPINDQSNYELQATHKRLPSELQTPGKAIYLHGKNLSDDLYMYLKNEIKVEANTTYKPEFHITFASNVPQGCYGVGGSPGESVYLKVGASAFEPRGVVDAADNYLRMNIDKGNQSTDGQHATAISHIHNWNPCEDPQNEPYRWVDASGEHLNPVTSSEDGRLWINVGTDSAFESATGLYFREIKVVLTPI